MTTSIFIFCIAFIQKILVAKNAPIDFDTYGHLFFAKQVQSQRSGPFGTINVNCIWARPFRHPFLWHWLLTRLPFEYVLRFQRWINPFFDAVFVAISAQGLSYLGWEQQSVLLISLLYVFTPIWFSRVNSGPRISSLTPRLLSEIAFNLLLVFLTFQFGIPPVLAFFISVLFGLYILLSSKFGIQVMFFLLPIISVVSLDPKPILVLFFSLLAAIAITHGDFLKTFKYQLQHLLLYFMGNLKGANPFSNRNSFKKLFVGLQGNRDFFFYGKLFYRLIVENSFAAIVFRMPILLAALYFFLGSPHSLFLNVSAIYYGPVAAAFIVFLIINIPHLLFLGEAERYLNHVGYFICILTFQILATNDALPVLYFVIGYGILFTAIEIFFLPTLENNALNLRQKSLASDAIVRFVQNQVPPPIMACYPIHASGGIYRFLLETNAQVLSKDFMNPTLKFKLKKEFGSKTIFFEANELDNLHAKVGVNLVVFDKGALMTNEGADWSPSNQWTEVNVGSKFYRVLKHI